MRSLSALALTAGLAIAAPASATTVFFDGFEGDTANTLSTQSTANFFVPQGMPAANPPHTVDVVGASNNFGITVSGPASGNVVDIDGTPGPGSLVSKNTFSYNAGDLVTLSFVVGGAQRGSAGDIFTAGLLLGPVAGSVTDLSGTGFTPTPGYNAGANGVFGGAFLLGNAPFTNSSISFRALTGGDLRLFFGSPSGDYVGPLLDNVKLDISAVPEPSTWVMMIFGIGMIGGAMRRRLRQSVDYNFA
jgi:hypothetical protein